MRARYLLSGVLLGALLAASSPAVALPAAAGIWPTTHRRLTENLTEGDVAARRSAASRLLTLPPKLARKLTQRALQDPDIEVRLYAARAAVALGTPGGGDQVKDWLTARDVRLRVAACELIEAAPTRDSIQALARVLGDAQPNVRRVAAAAMGASGNRDVVAPLLGHLDDSAPEVRLEVVRALGRLGDTRAVVPLVSKLQDQEAVVRREAARVLGQLGDRRAVATLIIALQDKSVGVRVDVLAALGRLRAEDAVTAIAALFADADPSARLGASLARGPVHDAALRALGKIGSAQAIGLLVEALGREGPVRYDSGASPVRDAIVAAGPTASRALQQALATSTSQRLASSAALSLGQLRAAGTAEKITRAMQRGGVTLEAGLAALAELDDKSALPFVLEQLDTQDAVARQRVVGVALSLLEPRDRDGRVVDVVKRRVSDLGVPMIERIALVKLLGQTGAPRAQELLLALAKSKSLPLRKAVAEALGTLRVPGREVDKVLLKALGDNEVELRQAASLALAQVGADGAAAKLLHRLGKAAEQDRAALGMALSGALSRSTDAKLVDAVEKAVASTPAVGRDALFEGLGRMKSAAAGKLLAKLSKRADVDDRRKIAEGLAGHPRQATALVTLLKDADPGVRAAAAWSLGKHGSAQGAAAIAPLRKALNDIDVAVAGNAATALGKVVSGAKVGAASKALCGAADDFRAYVRAGALAGLRELGRDCKPGETARILRRDRSWRVRLSAARLLGRLAATPSTPSTGAGAASSTSASAGSARLSPRASYQLALRRCQAEERNADVAEQCGLLLKPAAGSVAPTTQRDGVLVFVVPESQETPQSRAPFALVFADGNMRLGVADRRGAVYEQSLPEGPIQLAVPAALAP